MHVFRSILLLGFVFISYALAQKQLATNISIGDDQANWEELWKVMSARQSAADSARRSFYVSGSTRPVALFDTILRVNAQARHKPRQQSSETEFLFQGDVAMKKRDVAAMFRSGGRRKRAVIKKLARNLWQRNNIAYIMSSDLGILANQSILEGIKQWENTLPCLGKWKDISKLSSVKRPRDYIHFIKGDGCYSDVGRQGGRQTISIGDGCDSTGTVLHEIGHAMGFWHEQSRTDRDKYVEIHWDNILPKMKYNFKKYSSSQINDLGVSYDYESVMHYGSKAFSKDDEALTISIKADKSKNGSVRLGQRRQLSEKDKKQARLLYNCAYSCSQLPLLSNGRKYGRNLAHGSAVLFYCNRGYRRVGLRRIQCNDGKWSGKVPRCLAICNRIARIIDGWVSGDGYFEGDELSFGCKENYVLEGAKVIKCIGYRRWNASKPRCREKCSDPSRNTNAIVIGNEFYHGKQVKFVCPSHSILVPVTSKMFTCRNGKWGGKIPVCRASCSPIPWLSNGRKYGRSLTHGSAVRFFCNGGYQRVGLQRVQCNDGRWSGEMPRCLASCSQLPRLSNGRKYGRRLTHGSTMRFYCNWGHQRVGSQQLQCNDGRWSANMPLCLARCNRILSINDGWVNGSGYLEGDQLRFRCKQNFVLEGAKIIKCTAYRRWNARKPRCRAPCKRFSAKPFIGGYLKKDGFRHNEEVTFGCRYPLVIDGQDTLRCNNGAWSSKKLPSCGGRFNL